ncbi:MAG: NADP-dependent oxidoreductase [Gammaproteobacteria bacterium]|jgi:NADPH-dependent curcumin reductase CurA|nr:NADP-dependent oxidoreductase [Gammaproteobacteria bacterium]
MIINRQWCLATRPQGDLDKGNFRMNESPVPTIRDNEFLIRNIYLSLDPTHRLWAREKDSYMPSVKLGDVMRGFTMGVVEKSNHSEYPVGSVVTGVFGWEDYSVSNGEGFVASVTMDPRLPLTARFGLFEHIGLTAYFGIMDILKPKHGETMVVSGAAGAVGSIAVQIGKVMGCRVVAIAGSDEKCAWLKDELGADEAVNYRKGSLSESLAKACPEGVDTFFDNVGGEVLEAVLDRINMYARIAMSGAISQYGRDDEPYVPSNIYNLLNKRALIQGFIVLDYAADKRWWAKAHDDITLWYLQGRMKYRLDVVDGLENAPTAVAKLFKGTNSGKLLVKVSEEPERSVA